ncbi:MAG: hypothetical protein K9L74_01925 [Candidatus Izimaplasma sp.]|nr:hypothetical protein [Candidatus Izimaplasma bacterium]
MNKELFDDLYGIGIKIMDECTDDNLKKKKKVFDFSYEKMKLKEDVETQEFYSVLHELKTYEFLARKGFKPKTANDDKAGPDFLCDLGYIECVITTKGSSSNKDLVEKQLSGDINRYKAILPRILGKLRDKNCKTNEYINNLIIDEVQPVFICIHPGYFIFEYNSDLNIDLIMNALYGASNRLLRINYKQENIKDYDFSGITKIRDKEIKTNIFALDEYKNITGVILSNSYFREKYEDDDFLFFLNPNTTRKIDMKKLEEITYLKKIYDGNISYDRYVWVSQKVKTKSN